MKTNQNQSKAMRRKVQTTLDGGMVETAVGSRFARIPEV